METQKRTVITIETIVNAPVEMVWKSWNEPAHITKWNQASDDWHCPQSENDLRIGGRLCSTMAAKDGSVSFDFEGIYSNVVEHQKIEYTIADGRRVEVIFDDVDGKTKITESFEAEEMHSIEMQRGGWSAILESFRKYTESL